VSALDIVFADAHLVVLNKPAGLLAVPGKTSDVCLSLQVQAQFADALIVHRLDMATSGLMVMARGLEMQRKLNAAFSTREVHKRYVAVVHGNCTSGDYGAESREGNGFCAGKGGARTAGGGHGAEPIALPAPLHEVSDGGAQATHHTQDWQTIDLPIIVDWPNRPLRKICPETGKPSATRWRCTAYNPERNVSRLALEPITGRSHQLRVHLLSIGHPIVGDALYAPPAVAAASPRLLLHAAELALAHPASGAWVRFCSPDGFGAWA
jgi:tRNA pseudouridine32 synthase/23S rRNA pseudouridine746 synthase